MVRTEHRRDLSDPAEELRNQPRRKGLRTGALIQLIILLVFGGLMAFTFISAYLMVARPS